MSKSMTEIYEELKRKREQEAKNISDDATSSQTDYEELKRKREEEAKNILDNATGSQTYYEATGTTKADYEEEDKKKEEAKKKEQALEVTKVSEAPAGDTDISQEDVDYSNYKTRYEDPSDFQQFADTLDTMVKKGASMVANVAGGVKSIGDTITLNNTTMISADDLANYNKGDRSMNSMLAMAKLKNILSRDDRKGDMQLANLYNYILNGTYTGDINTIKSELDASQTYYNKQFQQQYVEPTNQLYQNQRAYNEAVYGKDSLATNIINNVAGEKVAPIATVVMTGGAINPAIAMGASGISTGNQLMQNRLAQGESYASASTDVPFEGVKGAVMGKVFQTIGGALSKIFPIASNTGANFLRNLGIGGASTYGTMTAGKVATNLYNQTKGRKVTTEDWQKTFWDDDTAVTVGLGALLYGATQTINDSKTVSANKELVKNDFKELTNALRRGKYLMQNTTDKALQQQYAEQGIQAINMMRGAQYEGVKLNPEVFDKLMQEWTNAIPIDVSYNPNTLGAGLTTATNPTGATPPTTVSNVPTTATTPNVASVVTPAVANVATPTQPQKIDNIKAPAISDVAESAEVEPSIYDSFDKYKEHYIDREKNSETRNPRFGITKVRNGWNIDKIQKELKRMSSYANGASMILAYDTPEELADNIYYHGSNSVNHRLKAGSTVREENRNGGYGDDYHSISLSRSKEKASTFAGPMTGSGVVYPVVLRKNANVIEMPEIQDSIDLEDMLPELWEKGVDAVKIGNWDDQYSEEELVVLNPHAITTITDSPYVEYVKQYGKPKYQNLSLDEIKELRNHYEQKMLDNYNAKIKEKNTPIDTENISQEPSYNGSFSLPKNVPNDDIEYELFGEKTAFIDTEEGSKAWKEYQAKEKEQNDIRMKILQELNDKGYVEHREVDGNTKDFLTEKGKQNQEEVEKLETQFYKSMDISQQLRDEYNKLEKEYDAKQKEDWEKQNKPKEIIKKPTELPVTRRKFLQEIKRTGYINVNGCKIDNVEDLADLAQCFRDPIAETTRIIYISKGIAKIQDAFTSDDPRKVATGSMSFIRHIEHTLDTHPEIDGFWAIHNHPSGQAVASGKDKSSTKYYTRYFDKKFLGHIVLDHNEYANILRDGRAINHIKLREPTYNEVEKNFSKEGWVDINTFDSKTSKEFEQKIASLGSYVKNGKDLSTLILLSNNGTANLLQALSNDFFDNSETKVRTYIKDLAIKNGATMACYATQNPDAYRKILNKVGSTPGVVLYKPKEDGSIEVFKANSKGNNYLYSSRNSGAKNIAPDASTQLAGPQTSLEEIKKQFETKKPLKQEKKEEPKKEEKPRALKKKNEPAKKEEIKPEPTKQYSFKKENEDLKKQEEANQKLRDELAKKEQEIEKLKQQQKDIKKDEKEKRKQLTLKKNQERKEAEKALRAKNKNKLNKQKERLEAKKKEKEQDKKAKTMPQKFDLAYDRLQDALDKIYDKPVSPEMKRALQQVQKGARGTIKLLDKVKKIIPSKYNFFVDDILELVETYYTGGNKMTDEKRQSLEDKAKKIQEFMKEHPNYPVSQRALDLLKEPNKKNIADLNERDLVNMAEDIQEIGIAIRDMFSFVRADEDAIKLRQEAIDFSRKRLQSGRFRKPSIRAYRPVEGARKYVDKRSTLKTMVLRLAGGNPHSPYQFIIDSTLKSYSKYNEGMESMLKTLDRFMHVKKVGNVRVFTNDLNKIFDPKNTMKYTLKTTDGKNYRPSVRSALSVVLGVKDVQFAGHTVGYLTDRFEEVMDDETGEPTGEKVPVVTPGGTAKFANSIDERYGETRKGLKRGETIKLTMNDVNAMEEELLKMPFVKEFMEAYNELTKVTYKLANDVYEAINGTSLVQRDFYFRIKTDPSTRLRQNITNALKEKYNIDASTTLLNADIVKPVIEGADNQILIFPIDEVISELVDSTALYYGYATALYDINTFLNAVSDDGEYLASIIDKLDPDFINNYNKIVDNIVVKNRNSLTSKMASRYTESVLNANVWLALKQAGSYFTTAQFFDHPFRSLLAGAFGKKGLAKEIKDYYKENGIDLSKLSVDQTLKYFWDDKINAEISTRARGWTTAEKRQLLKHTGLLGRIKILDGFKGVDYMTVRAIAYAMIKDALISHDYSFSDDTFRDINMKFLQAHTATQPNSSAITRAPIQNGNIADRALSFMKDPIIKEVNALADARMIKKWANKEGTKEDKKEANKNYLLAIIGTLASIAYISAINRTKKGVEGKDDGSFFTDMIGNALALTVGIDQITGALIDEYSYDVSTPDTQAMNLLFNMGGSLRELFEEFAKGDEASETKISKNREKIIEFLASFSGIPYKNMKTFYNDLLSVTGSGEFYENKVMTDDKMSAKYQKYEDKIDGDYETFYNLYKATRSQNLKENYDYIEKSDKDYNKESNAKARAIKDYLGFPLNKQLKKNQQAEFNKWYEIFK